MKEADLALYLMLGQTAQKEIGKTATIVPTTRLPISSAIDLAELLPAEVRLATEVAEVFKLLHIFENYLRDFVLSSISEKHKEAWWEKVPLHIRQEIEGMEKDEDRKAWMAHTSRSKLDLATLPQLLAIIEDKDNWKEVFEEPLRDKSLIQETRAIGHTRNLVCHMSLVSTEETERLKQVIRDWFRIVAP